MELVTPQVGWKTNPTAEEVADICQSPVPSNLCAWSEHKWRVFHVGPYKDELYTGHMEIIFKNEQGDLWECHDGQYTKEADASNGVISYNDYTLDEDLEVRDFGYYWW